MLPGLEPKVSASSGGTARVSATASSVSGSTAATVSSCQRTRVDSAAAVVAVTVLLTAA